MPELPEVETIRRDLSSVLKGKRVRKFTVTKASLLKSPRRRFTRYLVGATVTAVKRRAKLLMLELSSGYVALLHLKMTGQLVWRSRRGEVRVGGHPISGVSGLPNRYTYITLTFSDGAQLFFNDVRQFGYWRLVPAAEVPELTNHYGPEPLTAAFTPAALAQRLARRGRTSIKAALLDQSVVAGLGNIYVDESLFVARLRPQRRVGSLSQVEITQLWRAVRAVLRRAVTARGTSFSTYVDGMGRSGTYWAKRLVYGKAGEPCPRCRREILRGVVAGRGTHWCMHCQK